jgi:acetyltransferase-like isoleucine patch superfamily enzyme
MSYQDNWKKGLAGHEAIRSLHESLRDEIKHRWNRSVPFADELFDRWERAVYLGFGRGATIYDSSIVLGNVDVGEDTWVGPFTILDGSGGLKIGHHCSISAGAQIYTHSTVMRALTAGAAATARAAVTIGDCTYVGPNAIVTAGVTVGSQCVVGANSLVNRDVPPLSVVYGNPARVVGRVEVQDDTVRLVYDEDLK